MTSGQPPGYGPPSYGPPPYGPHPYGPYGAPGAPPAVPSPRMRAAAADRDRTIEVLKAAYGEGRLTDEELEDRSGRALAAQTYGDLTSVVEDLPGGTRAVLPYQPASYPAERPTNRMAIGSLVCAMLGFIPGSSILAVVLGHMARARIKQTGERGDGLALAGLVLGYLGIIVWSMAILGLVAVSHDVSQLPSQFPGPGKPGIPPGAGIPPP